MVQPESSLSEEKLAQIKKDFEEADKNGNGYLTEADLIAMHRDKGVPDIGMTRMQVKIFMAGGDLN